jgi:hypothetical protein
VQRLLGWLNLARGKFFDCGRDTAGSMSTTHGSLAITGITDAEREAILTFHARYPLEGYRRLSFMMLDQGTTQKRGLRGERLPYRDTSP